MFFNYHCVEPYTMNLLQDTFQLAVETKKISLARQEEELANLMRLAKKSTRLKVKWDECVTTKNAYKTIQVAQVLVAFEKRLDDIRAYENIDGVRMSTHTLWKYTHPSANVPATTKFRSHLNWLKEHDFLSFDKNTNKWRLTEKAISRLSV